MKSWKLPLEKKDIHYDPLRGEVSLKREKFDGMIQFIRDLMEETQRTENARDTAVARRRRADAKARVWSAYADVMEDANQAIRDWVNDNTIQELSRRAQIPYATCHRIIRERLSSGQVDVDTMKKMLKVTQVDAESI